ACPIPPSLGQRRRLLVPYLCGESSRPVGLPCSPISFDDTRMTRLMAEVRSSLEDVLSMLSITGVRCPCSRPSLSLGCCGSGAVSGLGLDCDRPATVDHLDELDTNVTKTCEAVDAQKDDESLSVEHLLSVYDQGVADLRRGLERPRAFRRPDRSLISSSPRTDLADDCGILSHLIAKLLVHPHNRRILGLEVGKCLLEAAPYLGGTPDPTPSGQELVCQARLRGRLDRLEHPGRIGGQVNLAQRQVAAQDCPGLILGPSEEIEGAHIIIDIPTLFLGGFDQGRVVGRESDEDNNNRPGRRRADTRRRTDWSLPGLRMRPSLQDLLVINDRLIPPPYSPAPG